MNKPSLPSALLKLSFESAAVHLLARAWAAIETGDLS
jgi:hypothetical protein